MSDLCVQVDPLNPGQFYACCGLLELAALERGPVVSRFEQEPGRPRTAWFYLRDVPDLFLSETLRLLRDGASRVEFDKRHKASIRPATLHFGGSTLVLDWWLDEFRENPSKLKCWAGKVTTRKLFKDLLPLLAKDVSGSDVFLRSGLTSSKFGVDPRAAWDALDLGYSPDAHKTETTTFAAVEALAAIGLQTFRPVVRGRSTTALYNLWTVELPLCVARNAANAAWEGLPHHAFQFSIGSRGQSYKFFRFAEASREQERNDES